MENSDRDLIKKMIEVDMRLKRLYDEHELLEQKLSQYEHKSFLTVPDELEQKRLKFKKLKGVERMMGILTDYRSEAA